jgi:hypothetical protein
VPPFRYAGGRQRSHQICSGGVLHSGRSPDKLACYETTAVVLFLAVILSFCSLSPCVALAQDNSKKAQVPQGTAVHQLFLDDQRDRGDTPAKSYPNPEDVNRRDAVRRSQVRQLLTSGALQSAQDFHDAAYIFQHGPVADDYLLAHILAVEAIVKGDASSKWIAASTLDRYLQAIGKGQVFGTQYPDKTFLYYWQHQGDLSAMNKPEAHEPGMMQQPYDEQLVPDALRKDFCVPSREQQQKNLKEFEASRYPDGIIPPGCTR